MVSFLGTNYISCSKLGKSKCRSEPLDKDNGVTVKRCQEMCDENKNCNFIFWNTGRFCEIYNTCDEIRDNAAKGFGTIFAKHSCPGNMLDLKKCCIVYHVMLSILIEHGTINSF